MKVSYDPYVDAAYIRLTSKKQKVTTHTLGDWVAVDVGENGSIVGFEILDASISLDIEQLKKLDFVESGPPRRWKPVSEVAADRKVEDRTYMRTI